VLDFREVVERDFQGSVDPVLQRALWKKVGYALTDQPNPPLTVVPCSCRLAWMVSRVRTTSLMV
jgi:hypothetical protein